MRYASLSIALAVAFALPLAGCKTKDPGTPEISIKLPKAPAYYWDCFDKLTPAAEKGKALTRDRVVRLIADLSVSDKAKSQCGKDLLQWYATVRASVSKAGA